MTHDELKRQLEAELGNYAARLNYDSASGLRSALVEQRNLADPVDESFYQVDVRLLQKHKSATEDWVQILVAVDDGRPSGGLLSRLLHIVRPVSGALIFHRDGRIERFL